MNKLDAAKILLQRNFYSKKSMSSSTRKLYESYELSSDEECSVLEEIYDILKSKCISVDDALPFFHLMQFIKEYKFYSKLNEVLELIENNTKNRSHFGLLNLYESVFQFWYLNEDKENLNFISNYLTNKLQDLSYVLSIESDETIDDKWNELDIKNQEEYVFNRCNHLLNILRN